MRGRLDVELIPDWDHTRSDLIIASSKDGVEARAVIGFSLHLVREPVVKFSHLS